MLFGRDYYKSMHNEELYHLYYSGKKRWLWHIETGLLFLGLALVFRHLCLQAQGADMAGTCLPPLARLLDMVPLSEALRMIAHSSGECARIAWEFLGLSLPAWLGVFYLGLLGINIAEFKKVG